MESGDNQRIMLGGSNMLEVHPPSEHDGFKESQLDYDQHISKVEAEGNSIVESDKRQFHVDESTAPPPDESIPHPTLKAKEASQEHRNETRQRLPNVPSDQKWNDLHRPEVGEEGRSDEMPDQSPVVTNCNRTKQTNMSRDCPGSSSESQRSSSPECELNSSEDDESNALSVAMTGPSNTLNVVINERTVRTLALDDNTQVNVSYTFTERIKRRGRQSKRSIRMVLDFDEETVENAAFDATQRSPVRRRIDEFMAEMNYIIDLITPGSIIIDIKPSSTTSVRTLIEAVQNGKMDQFLKEILSEESVMKHIRGKKVTVNVNLEIPKSLLEKEGISLNPKLSAASDELSREASVTLRKGGDDDDDDDDDQPDGYCDDDESQSSSVDPVKMSSVSRKRDYTSEHGRLHETMTIADDGINTYYRVHQYFSPDIYHLPEHHQPHPPEHHQVYHQHPTLQDFSLGDVVGNDEKSQSSSVDPIKVSSCSTSSSVYTFVNEEAYAVNTDKKRQSSPSDGVTILSSGSKSSGVYPSGFEGDGRDSAKSKLKKELDDLDCTLLEIAEG